MNLWNKDIQCLVMAALAWSAVGCSAAPGEENDVPLASTVLAELQVGQSKVIFERLADGSISVAEGAPPDAVRAVTSERMNLSPSELFRTLAPGRAVPDAILQYELYNPEDGADSHSAVPQGAAEAPETPVSGLAGKNAWFVDNFCGWCGATYQGCVPSLGSGSWYYSDTHKSESWWFPQTGNGMKVQYRKNGSLLRTYIMPLNEVWSTGFFHWTHSLFGLPNDQSIKYTPTEFAGEVVSTSAWFASGDQFISSPGCQ